MTESTEQESDFIQQLDYEHVTHTDTTNPSLDKLFKRNKTKRNYGGRIMRTTEHSFDCTMFSDEGYIKVQLGNIDNEPLVIDQRCARNQHKKTYGQWMK